MKDDYSLIWRKDADYFREIDSKIIKRDIKYVNVIEEIKVIEHGAFKNKRIMITKIPILNRKGICTGLAASHIALPEIKTYHHRLDEKDRLWLPDSLRKEYLTKAQVKIFRFILQGKTSKQIAQYLKISFRTVEEHTNKIKKKLQCSHKLEIISVAVQYGLAHI